jgi:methionyl-tRNA synthetase
MSKISSLILTVLKPIIVSQLERIADDITPEDIEEKLNLDGLIAKLEADPKYAELKPFLEKLEQESEDFEKQLAILLDAILDVLVDYVSSKI